MLQVEIEDGGMTQRLEGIALRAGKIPQSVFEGIGAELIRARIETFQQGGRPTRWPPSRSAMSWGRQTLINTGALMNANQITSLGNDHVEVSFGEGLKYSVFHQYGTGPQTVQGPALRSKEKGGQRKFFWWKFKQTGDPMWKAMAFSSVLKGLPIRKHVQIQDESRDSILQTLRQYVLRGNERFQTTVS